MLKLQDKFKKKVVPGMKKKFSYVNEMAVPKIEKVVINTGYGKEVINKNNKEQERIIDPILRDLALISGQKAVWNRSLKDYVVFNA